MAFHLDLIDMRRGKLTVSDMRQRFADGKYRGAPREYWGPALEAANNAGGVK